MAVEIPEAALGPKMLALRSDRMRVFAYLMACGEVNATQAARGAGYVDTGGGIKVWAHRLVHDSNVLEAIEEAARNLLRGLGPLAIRRAKAILEDPRHPSHARIIETVLDRTGYLAKSEHTMRVEHAVDVRELEALARRLAAETGVPEEKLLGNAKVIEGEVADG
jgi:hypothetical protein